MTTMFQFALMPSLRAKFSAIAFDGETNIIEISWPAQPSTFQVQQAGSIGLNTFWQTPLSQVFDNGDDRFMRIQLTSAGAQSYYRLVWPGGY